MKTPVGGKASMRPRNALAFGGSAAEKNELQFFIAAHGKRNIFP